MTDTTTTADTRGSEGMDILGMGRLEYPKVIGEKEVMEAATTLAKYKQGKAKLEDRIVKDELWWKLRHWEAIGKEPEDNTPEATSAWTFNTLINKHADAMDNYPIPAVLPREKSDEDSAKILSEVLPVILENNDFIQTYDRCWWDKLKHGTAVYGVLWNPTKENGLGDIDITEIDLLNIFWEPGVNNIQDSRNLFITQLVDNDILKAQYPEIKGTEGDVIQIAEYIYDDSVDTSDKTVVVDWYYKKDGLLHYCKFTGKTVLYATENDGVRSQTGLYDHGLYPVVFDVLYPEEGTPCGFGLIAINKNPQIYIDSLSSNILESSMIGTKKRFFVSESTNVNADDFADWTKPFIPVAGNIDDTRIKEFTVTPISPVYQSVLEQKIQEMKETSGNRDMNSGGTAAGVTAASAIAALQEAGNKTSRDMISSSYRAYTDIISMTVELCGQFYEEERTFRITGTSGQYDYVAISQSMIAEQVIALDNEGNDMYRKPVFDYKIKAMKRNPFSRMEENERAKELYAMGFFNPEKAQEALIALEMMDFEGIETIKEKVSEGQTLLNMLQQATQTIEQLGSAMGLQPSVPMPSGGGSASQVEVPKSNGITDSIMRSQTPQGSYTQKLLDRTEIKV